MVGGMASRVVLCATIWVGLLSAGCECDTPPDEDGGVEAGVDAGGPPPPPVIGVVPETARYAVPGLTAPAYVVYTEGHVPHIYAENELDLVRIQGFVTARDRYFVMDLGRRLMEGRLAELIGDAALETDIESRGTGSAAIADLVLSRFTDEQREVAQAYADGVNFYIAQVFARRAPLPSELEIAGPVLGETRPMNLLEEFTLRDMAAWAVVVLFESSFEDGDVGRARGAAEIAGRHAGEALETERTAGLQDYFWRVTNVRGYSSAGGFSLETGTRSMFLPHTHGEVDPLRDIPPIPRLPDEMMDRLQRSLDRIIGRFGRDEEHGWGSNAWAISGDHTADGATLVAADPHLGGSTPTSFYRMGRDTRLLGDGDIHEVGSFIQGVPAMGFGTNGEVAWGGTQFFGDNSDWYTEEIVLDGSGMPMETVFAGGNHAIQRVDEEYTVADVPGLDSVGRTETLARFVTSDGRLITMIEGRDATADEVLGAGESLLNLLGNWVVPEDTDGDGVISGISFDYGGLDGPNTGLSVSAWSRATTVMDIWNNQDALVANSLAFVAGDSSGSVLFSAYQVMPCRAHLPREADGTWSAGADPTLLIDGTRFGSFEIPLSAEGRVDESAGASDPSRCVVPHDEFPAVINPPEGFVVSANNDPGTFVNDNSFTDDPWYIGGPWEDDARAVRIDELLAASLGSHTEDTMATIQGDTRSIFGEFFLPLMLEAIADAEAAASGSPVAGSPEERMAAQWTANSADYLAFRDRLTAWRDGGFQTPTGVETFYSTPTAADLTNSVATMLFNAWLGPFTSMAIGDERFVSGMPGATGDTFRMRVMSRMVSGRGAGNPLGLAEYNAATEESAYFDVLGTTEIESSEEITLRAIDDALTFLATDPTEPGEGGFGSTDWDTYLWGLRHHTRFDSLLSDFIGDDPSFGFLVEMFSIDPGRLPLMPGLDASDPRFGMRGFPRPGDNGAIDWGNPGFSGTRFRFGTTAILREIHALRGEDTTGRAIMQGGQTAIEESEYYDDQTRLWLANEYTPTRFSPEDVVEGAIERETFLPE